MIIFLLMTTLSFGQTQDQRQRQNLLDYLVDHHAEFQQPYVRDYLKSCPQMQATSAWCAQTFNYNNNLLTHFSDLLSKVRNENISQDRAYSVLACLPAAPPQFSELEDILKRLDTKPQCDALSKGELKITAVDNEQFILRRNNDNNYEAIINLDFQNVDGSVSPADMHTKINRCLSEFTPYFKTPTGETLNIRVMSSSEVQSNFPRGQWIPSTTVSLHRGSVTDSSGNVTKYRANSRNYPDSIECPTIVHETLHHLGLCDEYHEASTDILPGSTQTYSDAFSCRVVPDHNTVMAQQVQAIGEVVPSRITCQCTNDACRNTLRATDAEGQMIRDLMTKSGTVGSINYAVSKFCRDEYLDPRIYPIRESDKPRVLMSQTDHSVQFENRSFNEFPGSGGSGPRLLLTRRLMTCDCAGDASCIENIPKAIEEINKSGPATSCPMYTTTLPEPTFVAPAGAVTRVDGDKLQIVSAPTRTSLLSPNHFNKILFGNCQTGPAADYSMCASLAYKSATDPACNPQTKATCDNDAFFLGGSPQ